MNETIAYLFLLCADVRDQIVLGKLMWKRVELLEPCPGVGKVT